MTKFILRRLFILPFLVIGVATIVFFLFQITPGDPLIGRFGLRIANMSEQQVQNLRDELGLNDPVLIQYARYMGNLLRFDLGTSITSRTPVASEIFSRLPATLELAISTMIVVFVVSIPLGVLAALNRGKLVDRLLMAGALLGFSMPSFWLGIMLMLLFSLQLGWLPTSGRGEGPIFERLNHLVLPTMTLALVLVAYNSRIVRSATLEILSQDYVRTARSKGLHGRQVMVGHVLPNTLIPVVTVLGLQFAGLLAGTVIIESIFAWPGVGRLAVNAVWRRDYPVVLGTTMFFAVFYVVINLMVDVLYVALDPRIRYS